MLPNDGLTLDEDGALILDSTSVTNFHIWIANTGDGQVVKLDTRTYEELGRYYTGADPSRTSVNMTGDVYVGNRAAGSITKVSGRGDSTCPDTNGDGRITTSTGGGDILPWGEDDCVLWRTELAGANRIRAVAAQDDILEDGTVRSYVWVGDYTLQRIWKLDGDTGAILLETEVPYGPYGFALDARGNLWVSTISARLGRIDTRRCVDTASCMVETCTGEAPAFPECAGSIKQIIPLPSANYGITVDFMQRVWMGGGGAVKRYDPAAEPGSRIVSVPGTSSQGIGADAAGFIWAADQSGAQIRRFDADDPLMHIAIPAIAPRGIGIDSDGKVWGINRTNSAPAATVVTPGATLDSYTVERAVGPTLNSPYTYSDMTGLQLRLATNPFGWYRAIFEGCMTESMETEWDDVIWTGDVPEGTGLTLRARTSDSLDDLATMDWIVLGTAPPAVGTLSVRNAFREAMIEPGFYIEVEIRLETERSVSSELVTPRITTFGVEKVCPGPVA
jgi:streptogramin lyase